MLEKAELNLDVQAHHVALSDGPTSWPSLAVLHHLVPHDRIEIGVAVFRTITVYDAIDETNYVSKLLLTVSSNR